MKALVLVMKKILLSVLLLLPYLSGICQIEKTKGLIGVSIPFEWNHSEATYYRLGSPYHRKGNALSYGVNINYAQPVYKGVYAKIGIGYFIQSFGIIRPFNYGGPLQVLWSTDSYSYFNTQLSGGIGYKKAISKATFLNGNVVYDQYYSFKQKYINRSPTGNRINHKAITTGSIIRLNTGVERKIYKHISIAIDIMLPVFTHWNNDPIFTTSDYAVDEQQIARNKFSTGLSISAYYNL